MKTIKNSCLVFFLIGIHNSIATAFDPSMLRSPFASWGILPNHSPSINLLAAWNKFEYKREVVVAVVDTGIDYDHPFLKDNHHIPRGNPNSKNYGMDFSKGGSNRRQPDDQHGHGTHIAGIIKSVHPKVKILTVKYYNPQASGQENLAATIRSLRYAVDQGVDIINYSGGGPSPSTEELNALKEAERKGILVVAAAGNEKSDIDIETNAYYPASYNLSNIITVTAHNQQLAILSSSNYGKRSTDLAAPGSGIKSALPGGRSGFLTGTSQATAFVTGVAALIKAKHPNLPYGRIKALSIESAKKELTFLGKCHSEGRLNAGTALDKADQTKTVVIN